MGRCLSRPMRSSWQNSYDFIEKQRKAFKAKKKAHQPKKGSNMSRYYEMGVEILGHVPEKENQIKKAAENEWPFADWWSGEGQMRASAQDWLAGGESEEQFTERLSVAIWRANGGLLRSRR